MSSDWLRAWVPPALLALRRRLRPPTPDFTGVFDSPEGVLDSDPFASEEWLVASQQRLQGLAAPPGPGFLPASSLPATQHTPCLLLNLLSSRGPVRVLDFGGGTGAIYYTLHPYLTAPARVSWDVVDSPRLAELGRAHRRPRHQIEFLDHLPTDRRYDVVHINTALQYVKDYAAVLERLLDLAPRYFVLTRLLAGDVETYFTSQRLRGGSTLCVVLSAAELSRLFAARGYQLLFKAPALEESLPDARYDPGIAPSRRIPCSIHVVFGRTSESATVG